ncbi:MAG: hypothetical protein WAV48_05715, partial [Candidatus Magasanikiibacteriota bacterium]
MCGALLAHGDGRHELRRGCEVHPVRAIVPQPGRLDPGVGRLRLGLSVRGRPTCPQDGRVVPGTTGQTP